MGRRLNRVHVHTSTWHNTWFDAAWSLLLVMLLIATPAAAAMRLQERSLYMDSSEPGATTSYKVSFRYMSSQPVSSVDMLFCIDPIPYHPCVTPPGLDVSNATLSDQTGEVGYSILSQSENHIVLTRSRDVITANNSSYTFENIVNPTQSERSFAIRLRTHETPNATGPQIDFGSVMGQMTTGVIIQTQVPPILTFCVAEVVENNCIYTNNNHYKDMGELSSDSTLTAQSQMAVGTNASGGFAITANGIPFSAGTNVIDSLTEPTESTMGDNQFGINLVANDVPAVGSNPEGEWANAIPTPEYSMPNHYKYVSGDVVAFSPNVSLMKKFTVSYIVNSDPELRAGVYSTTITFIASGRF